MANAAWIAISSARPFKTGSAPGCPRHTGQTFVLGGAPNPVAQPQKILVRVFSWTCTSSPITGSYFAISSGVATPKTPEAMLHYRKTSLRRKGTGRLRSRLGTVLPNRDRKGVGAFTDPSECRSEGSKGFRFWPLPGESRNLLYSM